MKIKNLNEELTTKNVYTAVKEEVDCNGVVTSKETVSVQKYERRDDFIKVFVENLFFLGQELNNVERQLMFPLIAKMDYNNIVIIYSGVRKDLECLTGLSKASVSRGIKGLIEKQILLHLNTSELKARYDVFNNDSYLINPNIVGKGSFKDIKRLRITSVADFDFDKFEVKKEITRNYVYEGFEGLNKDNTQILSITDNSEGIEKEKIISIAKIDDDKIGSDS